MTRSIDRREALIILGPGLLASTIACRPSPSQRVRMSDAADSALLSDDSGVAPRIASGDLSPVDLTQRPLERIAAVDRNLKSYATVMADQAMTTAPAVETEIRPGTYRGRCTVCRLPSRISVTRRAYARWSERRCARTSSRNVDATVVARLRDAGAVLLGN